MGALPASALSLALLFWICRPVFRPVAAQRLAESGPRESAPRLAESGPRESLLTDQITKQVGALPASALSLAVLYWMCRTVFRPVGCLCLDFRSTSVTVLVNCLRRTKIYYTNALLLRVCSICVVLFMAWGICVVNIVAQRGMIYTSMEGAGIALLDVPHRLPPCRLPLP